MNSRQKVKNSFRMLVICMANGVEYDDARNSVKVAYRLSWCDAQELASYTEDLFALNYIRQKLDSMESDVQTPEWFDEIVKLKTKRDDITERLNEIMPVSPFYRGSEPMGVMRALRSALPTYI